MQNLNILASLWAGCIIFYPVTLHEDKYSRDEAFMN